MQPRWDRALNYMDRSVFPGGIDKATADLGTYKPYQGTRYAPEHFNQFSARQNAGSLMQGARNPLKNMDAASDQTAATLGGNYFGKNPGTQGGVDAYNPWTHTFKNEQASQKNSFQGMDNPFFRDVMKTGLEDMTGAYQKGTSADTTRMFNLSGAFGGSAHADAVKNNESALAKQMGNYVSGMQNQQYDRSAGLDESRIGRETNAQEGLLTRGNAGWQAGQDRLFNDFNARRGEQMNAAGMGYGEQGQAIERGNWASQLGQQNQADRQRQNDFDYQQFNEAQNHPYKLLQLLMGNYAQAQGQTGQNTTMYGGGNNAGQIGGGLLALLSQL